MTDIEVVASIASSANTTATLNWIPAGGVDFPVHMAIEKPFSFHYWAAAYQLDPNYAEVMALMYIPHHVDVTGEIVSWVLWAIVNVCLGSISPFPDSVAEVSAMLCTMNKEWQERRAGPFPRMPVFNPDICFKAREKWEEVCSWIQYWWEAWISSARPGHFFGG